MSDQLHTVSRPKTPKARTLPPGACRRTDPVEITIDGYPILVRELSPSEYVALTQQEFDPVTRMPGGKYATRLIESCVLDPAIPDADVLTVAFASKLVAAIEAVHGGTDADVKNGCGGKCTCSQSPNDSV